MGLARVFNIGDFSHWIYIGTEKSKASKLILALFKNIKNYLVLGAVFCIAATQITRPNAILLKKSAML